MTIDDYYKKANDLMFTGLGKRSEQEEIESHIAPFNIDNFMEALKKRLPECELHSTKTEMKILPKVQYGSKDGGSTWGK